MDLPKPGNIPQYDLLRVTAMLLIVFCHCLLIPSEAFDTYDAINVVMPSCKVANCMSYVFDMIATCVLPMFMFLSGALLYKGFTEKGRGEFKSFFKKKWSRLMIPFFLVSCLYTIPIIVFFWNEYSTIEVSLRSIIGRFFFYGGSTHLWFIAALFWITLMAYFYYPYSFKYKRWSVIISVS